MIKRVSRKIIAAAVAVLIAGLLFSQMVSVAAPYEERLKRLTDYNYNPGHSMTREELCAVLADLFPGEELAEGDNLKAGVSREEAIILLGRIMNLDPGYAGYEPDFTDLGEISPEAAGYVAWFSERGIITGNTDGTFKPGRNIKSAEFAALTMRVYDYKKYNANIIKLLAGAGGSGSAGGKNANALFLMPGSVILNKDGGLIVFDTYNNMVRQIRNGVTASLSGQVSGLDINRLPKGAYLDGELDAALFNRPSGGVINSSGDLIIADSANHVIRVIKDGRAYTWCGTSEGYADGANYEAKFNKPAAVAIDAQDNIYVADTLNNCIRRIDADGRVTTVAGSPGEAGYKDGKADAAQFRSPSGIAVSADGKIIYVSDTGNHVIRRIENGVVSTIAGVIEEEDEDGDPVGGFRDGDAALFNLPAGITLAGDIIIVADRANNKIRAVTQDGVATIAGTGDPGDISGNALEARLNQPKGVYWHDNILYIADTLNNKIKTMPFTPE